MFAAASLVLRMTLRPIPPLDFAKGRNVILPLLSLAHRLGEGAAGG